MKIPLAEMVARAHPRRRKPIVLPAIVTTAAQEHDLFVIYMRVIRLWHEAARNSILPAYSKTLAEQSGTRDSVSEIEIAIANAASSSVQVQITAGQAFGEWAASEQAWHMRKLISSLKYATGIDLETMIGRGDAERTIAQAVAENMALIRNVSDKVRDDISGAVFRGLRARTPLREVAKEISDLTGLARKRALRIASDQTVKLSALLDQERQEQLGITHFAWMHSRKARPRLEHLARDGKVYAWDDPALAGDLPGFKPFCGCKAKGVLPVEGQEATEAVPEPVKVEPPKPAFAYESFKPLKSIPEAQAWLEANVTKYARFTKGVKLDGLNKIAKATQEVNERFGLPPLQLIGDVSVAGLKFPGRATAAYWRSHDTYGFRNAGTDDAVEAKHAAAAGPGSEWAKKQMVVVKAGAENSKLIDDEVKKRLAQRDELPWSTSTGVANVAYHELGHRLHLRFRENEINAALPSMIKGWQYLVSKYAGTNSKELLAESFSLYMQGDETQFFRIYPPLLALFRKLDRKVTPNVGN
jgi:SPP1 gp7 family putative phage head morphogenesis protein